MKPSGLGTKNALLALSLFFAGLCVCPSTAFAQDQKIILPAREVPVKTALGEIDKQTDYNVVVNWDMLSPERKVMFPASELSVREVLDQALAGTKCTWELDGKQIAVVYSAEEGQVYSTMDRNSLPTQMVVVKDPWSNKQITTDQLKRLRNGYWQTETKKGVDSMSLAILNFRVNSSMLERDYMNNDAVLKMIQKTFSNKDILSAMEFITVTSAASPEGNTAANEKLAADRAMAVKSYIMWRYPFMDRDRIFTFSIGEDWSGLKKMVTDDLGTPDRSEVLRVLSLDIDNDARRMQLKQIGGGAAYRYIASNMLPKLRGAAACTIYYKEEPEPRVIRETIIDTVYIDRVVETPVEKIVEVEAPAEETPYYMAIKTNMLYDAALLPNLAVEFTFGRRWSVEFEGQWSWWNTKTTHNNCWRIQTADVELRKWLGNPERTPLTGHYLGVYGMAGTYDVKAAGKDGYLSNMSYSMGVSYGYSMPLTRRLNLELGIAVGYMGGKYYVYDQYNEQFDIFPKKDEKYMNYVGPTKAKASLVWLIGSGVNDSKKK